MIVEFDQENRAIRPDIRPRIVRRSLTLKPSAIANTLNNPRNIGRHTQLVHLFRHGDKMVRQRRVINDHVLAGIRSRLLEGIRGPREKQRVEFRRQQRQQRE